jgi:O-antigen/teichoic acid export membrane protein
MGDVPMDDQSSPYEKDAASPPRGRIFADSSVDAVLDQEAGTHASIASRLGVPTIYMLLGNLFTLAVGLPLQIYVARVLGPGGVGVYGLLEAGMATAAGVLGLGVGMTVMRFVPEHLARHEYGEAVGLIRGCALVVVATGALAYAILLLLLPWIGSRWPAIEGYRWEIGTMGLMIPLSLLTFFLLQGLRGFQNIRSIVVGSNVIPLAMKTVLTLGAFAAGLGLNGYILSSVLATLCGIAWLSFSLVNHVLALPSATPTLSPLRKWLRFALASYSGSLLGTATSGLDRFLLGAFIGSSAVGILVVLRQLQMLPERFNMMLLVVGAPLFSAAHGSDDRTERQHIYHLMTDWVVRSALPLALFLLLFGRDVLALYGPEFAAAGILPLRILVGAQFFNLLCGPVGSLAMMSGLEWESLRLNAINTVLLGAGSAALIPFFGLTGVALAYALAVVFMNVALMILVRQKLGVRWWDRRYLEWLLQCAAAFAVASIARYLLTSLNAAELAACLIAMYTAAVGASFLRGVHEDDKQLLRHVRQAVWGRLQP